MVEGASAQTLDGGDGGRLPVDAVDRRTRLSSRGTAFVYVLPCAHDAILKLGFSRDPLQRMRALNTRYFEFFDLDDALLIETGSVRDARHLESLLGRAILEHSAPAPLQVPLRAAGHTEWYRGALPILQRTSHELGKAFGYRLHRPLRAWLTVRLAREKALLFDWTLQQIRVLHAVREVGDVALAARIVRALRNALDEFSAAGIELDPHLPAPVVQWYANEVSTPLAS